LLLVPTTSYRIGDFLDAAERLGVGVAVGSDQRQVLEQYSEGRTVTVDFADLERGVAQVATYCGDYPLVAIIGVDDETTLIAAKASQTLGLPHNTPDSVEATANKHRFRTRLANSGLPAPRFTLLSVSDDPARAARESFYPAVLKPLALSASRGVIRADNPTQFTAAFRRIGTILEDAKPRVISSSKNTCPVSKWLSKGCSTRAASRSWRCSTSRTLWRVPISKRPYM
jgi:formate-dependent phosphoribosylglycinamide formyltransferase (GAR transformylase)